MRSLVSGISGRILNVEASERRRLASHAFAVALVAAAAVTRSLLDLPGEASQFWLFSAAIAVTAARGGVAAAGTAILTSFLIARMVDGASLVAGLLFVAEGLAVALVVIALSRSVDKERGRMSALEPWMRDLKSTERQGRVVNSALDQLDEAAETVVILLDRGGRISDWRAGATRLYGRSAAEIVGEYPLVLFEDLSEDGLARIVSEARVTEARMTRRQRRSDNTTFEADIRISPLSRGGFDGFAMIVRDLAPQQAYSQLQEEADVANRQLSTLRHIADPSLNSLASSEFVVTLLDRLRATIDAEGVALVYMDKFRRRVLCSASGLQCARGVHRPPLDLRRSDPSRTLMIHNDPAGVLESSAAGWPEEVSSMMAVPVVRAGSPQAVMEVVNRTGRRATEWEIALVQVAAARIAGVLQEDSYADSGAVA